MTHDPEVYIEWEESLDRYFEFKETPLDRQYKLAKIKFTRLASIWLKGLQKQRRREDKPRINTWEKLKKHLRKKYVPLNFRQQLYLQWNNLTQGNKTVAEYVQEWERLSLLCDVHEIENMRIAKFLGGLREDIAEKMISTPNLTFTEMCSLAMNYERFANRKKVSQSTPSYNKNLRAQPFKTPNKTPNTRRRKEPDSKGKSKKKEDLPLKGIVCFKCHGRGHYKSACLNARAFTMQEWRDINNDHNTRTMLVSLNGREEEAWPPVMEGEPDGTYRVSECGSLQRYEDSEEESKSEEERERVLPKDEHYNLVIRRNFHTTTRAKCSNQRENIFQTRCKIKDKTYTLIIDGGSESNCISLDLVTELKLKTKPHPHPYKLKWLDNKASGAVSKQCLVSFMIGSYKDKVLCDVLDMSACHLLLGRPWQFDRKTTHDGFANIYTVRHEGKLKDLIPLSPHKTIPLPNTQTMQLMNRKGCEKEIKN